MRRHPKIERIGAITFNSNSHTITIAENEEQLSRRPFQLLHYLARKSDQCCSRMEIIEEVWNLEFDPGTNVVDVQIYKIRKMLERHEMNNVIQTVRGKGYQYSMSHVS